MLSRVADALYWMGRYVERAEHAARLLEVTERAAIDLAEVDPAATVQARNLARETLHLPDVDLTAAVFDEQLVGSVASSLFRARENARQAREVISTEMWDYLNQAHWKLLEASESKSGREVLSDSLRFVVQTSFQWTGTANATMGRGPGWLFLSLGQSVERTSKTCRIVGEQWEHLDAEVGDSRPGTNVRRLTLLRSCGSLEEYRKRHPTLLDPYQILQFLILDGHYPRTIRYSIGSASRLASQLESETGSHGAKASRAFGRLAARLDYTEFQEVLAATPGAFLKQISGELEAATVELQQAYFPH